MLNFYKIRVYVLNLFFKKHTEQKSENNNEKRHNSIILKYNFVKENDPNILFL